MEPLLKTENTVLNTVRKSLLNKRMNTPRQTPLTSATKTFLVKRERERTTTSGTIGKNSLHIISLRNIKKACKKTITHLTHLDFFCFDLEFSVTIFPF